MNKNFNIYWIKLTSKLDKKPEIFFSISIAFSMMQVPLFYSNQNTYLIKAVTYFSNSSLEHDWMANQSSYLFLFDLLIGLILQINAILIYFLYWTLISIFFFYLFKFSKLINVKANQLNTSLFFFSLFCLDFFLNLLDGIAGQTILERALIPSIFGVFLIIGIVFFLENKLYKATFFVISAAYFHPTYLLHSIIIILSFVIIIFKKEQFRNIINLISISVLIFTPLIIFLYYFALSADNELLKNGQQILISRIPHHTLFSYWDKKDFILKIIFFLLALLLVRKNQRLFLILLLAFIFSSFFSLIAQYSKNPTMLLMFGHRFTVWIVPVSIAIVLFKSINYIVINKFILLHEVVINNLIKLFFIALTIIGFSYTIFGHFSKNNELFNFLENLDYSNGSLLIPKEFENIRLNAKTPIFVDYKSHPFKADEVVEWYERIKIVDRFYESKIYEDRKKIYFMINAKEKINYILIDDHILRSKCNPIFSIDKYDIYIATNCFKNQEKF